MIFSRHFSCLIQITNHAIMFKIVVRFFASPPASEASRGVFWVELYFVRTKVSPFGNLITKIATSQNLFPFEYLLPNYPINKVGNFQLFSGHLLCMYGPIGHQKPVQTRTIHRGALKFAPQMSPLLNFI